MQTHEKREKREEIRRAISTAILKHKHDAKPDFLRKRRAKAPKPKRLIAYDLETTNIKAGTPQALYITAHGNDFSVDTAVAGDNWHARRLSLKRILRAQFLSADLKGSAFVAWNGNRFDAYLIAAALIDEPDLILHPYLTRSKALRGLRVMLKVDDGSRAAKGWEFLDGIAMTGLVGLTLADFVSSFAPSFPKLTNIIDFERETFDATNARHRAYAYRDSEGLFHAISRAQEIMLDNFDEPLAVTMGGACIKIFAAHMPSDIVVKSLIPDVRDLILSYVMRGGFCFCVRRYRGPVWKYDINQAYAAAMRECALPAGSAVHCFGVAPASALIYIARITATNPDNQIPFYHRAIDDKGRMRSCFSRESIADTWLTSIEIRQLIDEGWQIKVRESWVWPGAGFSMREYVDRLETLRQTCDGGPKGPVGTMVKATGNHSYGKTVEQIEPIEFVLAAECPDDCVPFYADGFDPIEFIHYRIDDSRRPKAHHQPHLGAWITAHVRMVVRRAALVDPGAWLYADTDCVIFSRDVTSKLDIHPTRYGAWKIEETGTIYEIIAKKVYTEVGGDKPKRSAKGMNVKRLSADDFSRWHAGTPPVQDQLQLANFLQTMKGAEMFRIQRREGTRVERSMSSNIESDT